MEFVELIKTPKLDGVLLYDHQNATVEGRLCITGHHLLLSARQENSQELWVRYISKIAKYVYKGILNIIKRKFIKKKSSI